MTKTRNAPHQNFSTIQTGCPLCNIIENEIAAKERKERKEGFL